MLGCFVLLLIRFAVLLLIFSGGELGYRAAYKVLQTGQHVFEPERPERDDLVGQRLATYATYRAPARHERRVTPLTKKKIGEAYGWRCACGCGAKLTFDDHVDHIRPLWKGGSNDESNLQPLNPRCHLVQTSRENQL